jgi:hypothetical protein
VSGAARPIQIVGRGEDRSDHIGGEPALEFVAVVAIQWLFHCQVPILDSLGRPGRKEWRRRSSLRARSAAGRVGRAAHSMAVFEV